MQSLQPRCTVIGRVLLTNWVATLITCVGSPLILYYSRIKRRHNSIVPNRGVLKDFDAGPVRVIHKMSKASTEVQGKKTVF